MRSPALALTWQIWWRHRFGLAMVVAFLFVFAVIARFISLFYIYGMTCYFGLLLLYVASVFSYGFDSSVESAASGFPPRLFLLPVRTALLIGLPMIQGSITVMLLWMAWAHLVLFAVIPPKLAGSSPLIVAACVALLQALLWTPFPWAWTRIIVGTALIPILGYLFYSSSLASDDLDFWLLCLELIGLSFCVAWLSVSVARHGATAEWGQTARRVNVGTRRELKPFKNAADAQFWYEMRTHFWPYPVAVWFSTVILSSFRFGQS